MRREMINNDCKFGSPARMVTCNDENFWDFIEKGIFSLVEAIINLGYKTKNSCQGHYDLSTGLSMYSNIVFSANRESDLKRWTSLMNRFCRKYSYAKEFIIVENIGQFYGEESKYYDIRISFIFEPKERGVLDECLNDFVGFILENRNRLG